VISLKATLTKPWPKTQGPAKDVGGPGEKDGQTIEEKQRSGCMEAGGSCQAVTAWRLSASPAGHCVMPFSLFHI
jgi:hypothetical protein